MKNCPFYCVILMALVFGLPLLTSCHNSTDPTPLQPELDTTQTHQGSIYFFKETRLGEDGSPSTLYDPVTIFERILDTNVTIGNEANLVVIEHNEDAGSDTLSYRFDIANSRLSVYHFGQDLWQHFNLADTLTTDSLSTVEQIEDSTIRTTYRYQALGQEIIQLPSFKNAFECFRLFESVHSEIFLQGSVYEETSISDTLWYCPNLSTVIRRDRAIDIPLTSFDTLHTRYHYELLQIVPH